MKDYVIITDSCADIERAYRTENDFDSLPMLLHASNGTDVVCDLDWSAMSPKAFYDSMRSGMSYKTTQINAEQYIEKFTPYLTQGLDILSISTASGLSGSFNSSKIAYEELQKKFPQRKILCVDSLRGSMAQGYIVLKAVELKKAGKSIDEVAAWVEENRLCVQQVGSVDTLTYLRRAGRVTGTAAFMSGIFNIKPLIISNYLGQNESISKVRGRKTSLLEILKYTKENVISPETQTAYIVHADCLADAEWLREQALTIGFPEVKIGHVGMVVGATVGPGMIGLYFHGKKVPVKK